MSRKFDAFKAALIELCLEHKVMLSSTGYEAPAVYDLYEPEGPVYMDLLVDETSPDADAVK